MIAFTPLHNLQPYYHNLFLSLYFAGLLSIILMYILFQKRFSLNIYSPNIYLFDYEAQSVYTLSLYNILSFILKYITWLLFFLALAVYCLSFTRVTCLSTEKIHQLFIVVGLYLIAKFVLELLYIIWIKKTEILGRIRFIRLSYENFAAFYFFLWAFLIYFFPYKNLLLLILIIVLSALWMMWILINFQNNISKHIHLKKYQIFLYLCLSEILPFIIIIGWIIFQIL